MPEKDPQIHSLERRSALSAAVSVEFDCSYAAAEANKAAYEIIEEKNSSERMVHVLGFEREGSRAKVTPLNSAPLSAEQPVKLALVEPLYTTPQTEVVFRKMFRRHVQIEPGEERKDKPILVAMFGDVALPLATFVRRKDGFCSYVQIGSEIHDDKFHVTANDDLTNRSKIIEAIRDTLHADGTDSEEAKTGRQCALQKLLDIEFEQNKDKLSEAFEAQLVRKCLRKIGADNPQELVVLGDNGETYQQRYATRQILDTTFFEDQRVATLQIARPVEGLHQDIIQLLAVSRGNIALPVARLNASIEQLTFENRALVSDTEQRKQMVYKLLSLVRNEPIVVHEPKDPGYYLPGVQVQIIDNHPIVVDELAVTDIEKQRALDMKLYLQASLDDVDIVLAHKTGVGWHMLSEGELPGFWLHDPDNVANQIRKKAYEFLAQPFINPNPYPQSRVLGEIFSRLKKEQDARAEVFAQLGAVEQLTERIGTTSMEEENLVQKLHDMRQKSLIHQGVIKGMAINNTVADITFRVGVQQQKDGCWVVRVSGKPTAMTDEPFKLLSPLCFSFDPTSPIFDQLNGTQAHLDELLEMFAKITPVKVGG